MAKTARLREYALLQRVPSHPDLVAYKGPMAIAGPNDSRALLLRALAKRAERDREAASSVRDRRR